jgi:hypothetical protein
MYKECIKNIQNVQNVQNVQNIHRFQKYADVFIRLYTLCTYLCKKMNTLTEVSNNNTKFL